MYRANQYFSVVVGRISGTTNGNLIPKLIAISLLMTISPVNAKAPSDLFAYKIYNVNWGKYSDPHHYETNPNAYPQYNLLREIIDEVHKKEYLIDGAEIILHYALIGRTQDDGSNIWPPNAAHKGITSPWVFIRNSDKADSRPEIHVLASDLRLMADIYSWSDASRINTLREGMVQLPGGCFGRAINHYKDSASFNAINPKVDIFKDFHCIPLAYRKPISYFLEITPNTFRGGFGQTISKTLIDCRNSNREFYKKLYFGLIRRALDYVRSSQRPDDGWWRAVAVPLEMRGCGLVHQN